MSEPFDSLHTAPSYEADGTHSQQAMNNEFRDAPSYNSDAVGPAVFDPMKAPPYEQQDFDVNAVSDRKDPALFNDERGRGVGRNPAGATGARSISRDRPDAVDAPRGRADGIDTGPREARLVSPSRAMGARSGSVGRAPISATIPEDQPYRGPGDTTGLRSSGVEDERGRNREPGPPSSGKMGSPTGLRSTSQTRGSQ